MFAVAVRVIFIYVAVLIFLRIMGKRQIGEMQPYEVVITLIIADLATIPMTDQNIPLINGVLPLAILVILHFIITFLSRKCIFIRRLFSGNPVVVISPKGIEYQNLKKLNMDIDDLQESIRICNYYSFDQVQYAIIETNGKMSVIPSKDAAPATAKDVKADNKEPVIPNLVIADGKMMKDVIKQQNMSETYIQKILNHFKIKNIKDIIVLSIDDNNKLYLQQHNQQFIVVEDIKKELDK